MTETQNYQNHVRWFPLVHFVIMPLLALNLLWQIIRVFLDFNWDRVGSVGLAFVLMLIVLAARLQALTVQNRVIRLEEGLRYKNILSPETAEKALQLPIGKIVALRFASDSELPELIEKTLKGEFANSKEIKLAIKNWRGDYLRA